MDAVIFFKAFGNLFLVAIMFLAIFLTSFLYILSYMMKGLTPLLMNKKDIFMRRVSRAKVG